MNDNSHVKIPDSTMFSIKISESMELRNTLRSGLFEAQGKNSDKIPLFVSWPPWLEDGIVCMYANDLHALLNKTIQNTASSFSRLIEQPEGIAPAEDFTGEPEESNTDKAREAARAILEKPLGQKSDIAEALSADTVDTEPEQLDKAKE